MKFEWNEAKRQTNIERHDIDFVRAIPLFRNPDAVIVRDDRKDYGEVRYILLCVDADILYQVSFTYRGDGIRLISVRKGNKRERRKYEKIKEAYHHAGHSDG